MSCSVYLFVFFLSGIHQNHNLSPRKRRGSGAIKRHYYSPHHEEVHHLKLDSVCRPMPGGIFPENPGEREALSFSMVEYRSERQPSRKVASFPVPMIISPSIASDRIYYIPSIAVWILYALQGELSRLYVYTVHWSVHWSVAYSMCWSIA